MSVADDSPRQNGTEVTLSRGLGVTAIVFMVVAAAAPLGVVVGTTPILIAVGNSVAAPILFLLATALLLIFAVGYTLMSRYLPSAGAFYSFIQAGFGRIVGTGAAVLALTTYFLLLVACTAYFSASMGLMVDHFTGVSIPWGVWMLGGFGLAGFLGYRNIDLSAKVLGVVLVVEVSVVVLLNVAILGQGGDAGLSAAPWSLSGLGDGAPGLGLMFCFLTFFGFEATAVFRNEAKDPGRTIPRATFTALIFIGVFYAVSAWCVLMGVGTDRAVTVASDNPTFVLDLAGRYVTPVLQDVMLVLLVSSQFACTLAFHNVVTRYLFTMGGKGILPRALGGVSSTHQTPSYASLVLSAGSVAATLVVIALGLDPILETFTWLAGAATLGIIIMMSLTGFAVVVYFKRNRFEHSVWKTVVAPVVSSLGLLGVLYLVLSNFGLLVGGKAAVEVSLIATVLVAFAGGAAIALRMRASDPDTYAGLVDEVEEDPTLV